MPTLQWWVRFQTRFKYYVNCQEIAEVHAYFVSKMGRWTWTPPECEAYYSIFWRGLSAAIYWPYFFLLL